MQPVATRLPQPEVLLLLPPHSVFPDNSGPTSSTPVSIPVCAVAITNDQVVVVVGQLLCNEDEGCVGCWVTVVLILEIMESLNVEGELWVLAARGNHAEGGPSRSFREHSSLDFGSGHCLQIGRFKELCFHPFLAHLSLFNGGGPIYEINYECGCRR